MQAFLSDVILGNARGADKVRQSPTIDNTDSAQQPLLSGQHVPDNSLDTINLNESQEQENNISQNPTTEDIQIEESYTYGNQAAWATLVILISCVIPQTLVEFTSKEKSLTTGITLAVAVPVAIELIQALFNFSGAVKKNIPFRAKSTAGIMCILMAEACLLDLTDLKKQCSPLGYNAAIFVTGALMKVVSNIIVPAYQDKEANAAITSTNALYTQWQSNKLCNFVSMHTARAAILFSATNAGGKLFEAMHIPLAEGLIAAGLTNFTALIIFSVLLNEFIGSHLIKASGRFKDFDVNPVSQLILMVALPAIFQAAKVLAEESLKNFGIGFVAAFLSHLIVQESGLGSKIDKGFSALLSKGYAYVNGYQPVSAEDAATNNQPIRHATV